MQPRNVLPPQSLPLLQHQTPIHWPLSHWPLSYWPLRLHRQLEPLAHGPADRDRVELPRRSDDPQRWIRSHDRRLRRARPRPPHQAGGYRLDRSVPSPSPRVEAHSHGHRQRHTRTDPRSACDPARSPRGAGPNAARWEPSWTGGPSHGTWQNLSGCIRCGQQNANRRVSFSSRAVCGPSRRDSPSIDADISQDPT